MLIAAFAQGTTYIEPTRSLTRTEQAEYRVSKADGVLRCTVLAVVDTLTPSRYQKEPAHFQVLLVKPHRWLKGQGPSTPMLVGWAVMDGPDGSTISALAASTPTPAVLFLRKSSWSSDGRKGHALGLPGIPPISATVEWYLNASRVAHRDSLDWSIGERDLDLVEAQVVDQQRALTPASLARRAEVIVLGRVVEGRKRCSADGFETWCTAFAVEERLAGVAADTVQVFWLMKWVPGPPRQVLFMERSGSAYEVVGVGGEGAVEAKGDSVPAWNTDLTELRGLIEAARAGQSAPGKGRN
jgi:hypothetical protein